MPSIEKRAVEVRRYPRFIRMRSFGRSNPPYSCFGDQVGDPNPRIVNRSEVVILATPGATRVVMRPRLDAQDQSQDPESFEVVDLERCSPSSTPASNPRPTETFQAANTTGAASVTGNTIRGSGFHKSISIPRCARLRDASTGAGARRARSSGVSSECAMPSSAAQRTSTVAVNL